ncbi:MAG: 30S ribosomal protein S16 [Melioribacteraceae bacterium]|nr:30S ribosomal protein S16 [Melioribacteraceae bacterium]
MAVKLRLRRMGKKRQPIYKVVAADTRSPRDGKFIEEIGLYNPKTEPATINLKEDRASYWLGVGAQPTDTVKNLLSKAGILLRRELESQGLSEDQVNAKVDEWKKVKEANTTKTQKEEKKVEAKKVETDAVKVEAKEEVVPEASEETQSEEKAE